MHYAGTYFRKSAAITEISGALRNWILRQVVGRRNAGDFQNF